MEIVPIVIGLTQLVKDLDILPKKYLSIVSVFVAIVIYGISLNQPELYSQLAIVLAGALSPKIYDSVKDMTGTSK